MLKMTILQLFFFKFYSVLDTQDDLSWSLLPGGWAVKQSTEVYQMPTPVLFLSLASGEGCSFSFWVYSSIQ